MGWRNTLDSYGNASMLFHWITAAAFIAAYVIAYYVIWIVDPETSVKPAPFGIAPQPDRVIPLLNIHWILGITIGIVTGPRLLWRLLGGVPRHVAGSRLEHLAAGLAHWALYSLLIIMPVSGYMTTYHATDFGLFVIPACRDTAFAAWLREFFSLSVTQLEDIMWAIHSFCGKWLAWPLVLLHVGAALLHHFVRKDTVLRRMLPLQRNTG